MTSLDCISRRSFLAVAAAAPFATAHAQGKPIPVGLELYSVRNELAKDPTSTLRAVAKMGYQCVEFFAPYFEWTPDQAKDMRKLLDDLGIRCYSTHNGAKSFTKENLPHAIELNQAIGSKFIVMASAGNVHGLDGWKGVAETLERTADQIQSQGLRTGYHNHIAEFQPLDGGERPMDVLAANTGKNVMLQLDVGHCLAAGADPVAWIDKNPGRINSLHCKGWSPEKGMQVLLGEGVAPWKQIFQAAEKTGGVEFYLIEQEGSRFTPMETAEKSLQAFRKLKGS